MSAEKAIEVRIARVLAKIREGAPSEAMLGLWYRTAKSKYRSAVLGSHNSGFLNEEIMREYALKEACKRYAEEKGFSLEV